MLGGTNSNSQLIKNLDVTLTENGTFVSGEDYTGFGTVTVAVPPDVMDTELSITPTATDVITIPTWDEYTGPFTDPVTGTEYAGAGNIKVRRISSWIDSNISADNIRKGQTILGVSGNVIELLPQTKTTKSTTTQFTIYPDSGYNALSSVTVNPLVLQDVTHVTPKSYSVTVYKGYGYDGMNSVQIDAVTAAVDSNIQPENIKKNVTILGVRGTYDNYVAPVVQPTTVSPTTSEQILTPPSGVDGFNRVAVNAVTSAIDANIRPENIKRDVEILGVIGTYRIENLQDKTVDPQQYIQTVTFDSTLGYEGLNSVTVNPVTSSVDSNIRAGNIKKDVVILGVTGEYDPQPVIQDPVTINPDVLAQSVTPDLGYDGLSRVNINAVTASIDANILAENIKKNISILGVTGEYEGIQPNYQESKTVQPVTSGDIEVTADPTYDALLKVIVKAVTASIDPNIMPKNIRKNISILGVLGTMEEGGEQKWFDFSGIQNFVELNQDAWSEGGNETISIVGNRNNYELENFINETFPGIENINAVMFTQVYGYDDEEITDDKVTECYINFIGGSLYMEYSKITNIPDQIRYFYPFINDYGVNGLTMNLAYDDGLARTMKLYVLTDSTRTYQPVPVLVTDNMDSSLLPAGYDDFRFVKNISIPAHDVFIPKVKANDNIQFVLRDEDAVRTRLLETANQPDIIEVSAYDRNYDNIDLETNIIGSYKLKDYTNLVYDPTTYLANQRVYGETGYIKIPGTVEKKNGYVYYFKFKPRDYTGYNNYFTLFDCNNLFKLGLYRPYNYGYYYIGYVYNWTSATGGSWTTSNTLYTGNTYWFRVRVSGTTTGLDLSTNGYTWTNFANVTSSYINPTNTNDITIYSLAGINNDLFTDEIYITDSSGNKVYSVLDPIYIHKTSHEIVDRDNDNILEIRDESRKGILYQGNEIANYNMYDTSNNLLDLGTGGYIELQNGFKTGGKTWEICQHFRLPPITSSANRHLVSWAVSESNDRRNCLWVDTSNYINWRVYYANNSALIDGRINNSALTVGTSYYIKYGWDGYRYYMYCSTNANFTNIVSSYTYDSTNSTYAEGSKLLIGNWNKAHTTGSMRFLYLDNYTQIRLGNEIIWKPQTESLYGNLVDYTDDGSPITLDAYLAQKDGYTPYKDISIFGSPTISDIGIISNLNRGNYIWYNKKSFSLNNNFEIYTKFMFTSTYSDWRLILASYKEWGWNLGVNSESKLHWNVGNGAGTWSNGITGTEVLNINTWYYVKLIKTGTTHYLYHSTDNETWVLDGSVSYSTGISNYMTVGTKGLSYGCENLYIDLVNTYIRSGDELYWQPQIYNVSKESIDTKLYNIPLLSNEQTSISKFNKQYIEALIPFKPENNTWEICTKYKFNSLFGCLFGNGFYGEEKNIRFCAFLESDGSTWLGLSSDGESWDICDQMLTDHILDINTWYWFKLSFDGTHYKFMYSIDNIAWTELADIADSTPIYDIEDNIIFGTNPYVKVQSVNIDGFVDLNEMYYKIDNTLIWQPTFRVLQNYDWVFTQDSNWSYTGLTNLGKKGELIVPEHNIYEWDQLLMRWRGLKQLTFNLDDPDGILYTKVIEN